MTSGDPTSAGKQRAEEIIVGEIRHMGGIGSSRAVEAGWSGRGVDDIDSGMGTLDRTAHE